MLQLTNTLSGDGPARLHLVSGDELRVITRAEEPLFEDLFHVNNPFINCIIELVLIIRVGLALFDHIIATLIYIIILILLLFLSTVAGKLLRVGRFLDIQGSAQSR